MDSFETAAVVCECCELAVPWRLASPIHNAYQLNRGWRCRMCNEHQGKQLKMAQEHEEEVRIRWGETADKLNAALDRADHYEERMKSALRSREGILRQFEKIANYHQATD